MSIYREIKIGNVSVPMRASGLTEYIYKTIWNKELMTEINDVKKTRNIYVYRQLGFVMAWQAMKRDQKISEAMKTLSISDYIDWIDQFNERDLLDQKALLAIQKLWLDSEAITVESKNGISLQ